MVFEEGPERRSGGVKTKEIGKRDFHSDDNSIISSYPLCFRFNENQPVPVGKILI